MSLLDRSWMRNWLGDAALRRLARNAGVLLSGSAGASALGLLAVVLATRALGPAGYGVLILIYSYALAVDRLLNFQSWQALIKYGADALDRGDDAGFMRLMKAGTALDAGSALLSAAVAVAAVPLMAAWQGWDAGTARLAALYSGVIALNLVGTPTAALRLFDRFGWLARLQVAGGVVKVVAAGVAAAGELGVGGFLVAWGLSDAVGYVLTLALGWRELAARGYGRALRQPLTGLRAAHPGFLAFVATTNVQASVKLSTKQADVLIVGGVLGAGGAGLYALVRQLAGAVARVSDPFYQAVYPDLARLWSSDDRAGARRLVGRVAVLFGAGALAVWVGFALFGDVAIRLVAGSEFLGARAALTWYLLGTVLVVAGLSLQPALLAAGRHREALGIVAAVSGLYLVALYTLSLRFGLAGAGAAYLVFAAAWFGGMGWAFRAASHSPPLLADAAS